MDGFDIFMIFMTYSLIGAIVAIIIDEEDNLLGRAFIWPMILLIASIKAVRSVYLETKAEMKNWTKTVNKK
jgi:hypothetical protein